MEGEHLVDHFGTTGQPELYQICTRTLHTGAQLGICCYVETGRYLYPRYVYQNYRNTIPKPLSQLLQLVDCIVQLFSSPSDCKD